MKIRQAQPNDLPILLRFEQGVIEEERPCNDAIKESGAKYYDLDHMIADPNTCLQVVERDGRVVGCGYAQLRPSNSAFVHDRHAYLGFMYVAPEFRRQGINKIIIESLFSWCKSSNVHNLYLDVYTENSAAVRAYEKIGFSPLLLEMKLSLGNVTDE